MKAAEQVNTMLKFPIFLDLAGKPVRIFGGGAIALRRASVLTEYGAVVTVVAPSVLPELAALPVAVERRPYRPGELDGELLALAATDDGAVNAAVVREAREKGILANDASNHENCDFYFPAVVRTETLSIGVTGTGENHREVRDAAQKLREAAL